MLKKILYIIVVIVVIVILAIMWKDSKKTEAPIQNQESQVQNDSPKTISDDIDKINVDAGIDSDLNNIDQDIKTL
jgi:hypothetical protein